MCGDHRANYRLSADIVLQVGSCIVGVDNIILGIGYNGFPRGCPDGKLPWAKVGTCTCWGGMGGGTRTEVV